MRTWVDNKLIEYRLKSNRLLQRLLEEEDGDTNFVSIIVLIVIIIAIAGVFRDKLRDAVKTVFDTNLSDFLNNGGTFGNS